MGNQLAAIAPSQIFPVEYYLTDLPGYQFDSSLGSTRFFKVAKAKFREGPVVVKVFAVHDPTLPLRTYRDQIEECDIKLENSPNCLSFKKTVSTEKAELLFRQFVKDNLYDRISTRPFLNNIEKKWIAFQILCAVNQAHKAGVCHGDIKLENIMVTSWNWVLLTDFASYKPTYLPEDNPADFSYFFDTSRRRTCYVAPERFVKTLSADLSDNLSGTHYVLPDEDYRQGELTPAMDIFSTGCVLSELFTEGHAPFDFSQLLSYRNGDYSPSKAVDKIEDAHIKELVLHMMQKDPSKRFPAEIYLEMTRGNVFPHYFYSFLYKYMQGFLMPSFVSPQDKINRLLKDLGNIVNNLKSSREHSEKHVEGLVIIVSLVTSCLRAITQCSGKLQVLNVIQALVPNLSDELTLDRLLPYMLQALDDNFPQVRAAALEVLSRCLTLVKSVARSDANIFPEYVLPKLEQKAQDEAVMVRVTFAKNIAVLAETSLRFLEMSQIRNQNVATDEESHTCFHTNYETELQSLHEIIQQNVSTLLTDSDNIVKQTLLEFGITRLCIFFGRKKANDVVLSHMITVLNDKEDRHLRGAFFDSIVGVAAYIGWQCCPLIKPLLQQGFCDEEEFVTSKALHALSSLTELGLFQKHILYELLVETCPFLCHPNIWIRNNTVGFICSAAKTMNIADIHCKLIPLVEPFLRHAVIQIDSEVVLLNQLIGPIPRPIFETVIRCRCIELLIDTFKQRQYLRKPGITSSSEPVGIVESVKQVFRRLLSDGMSVACEEQLLAMKEYIIKQHKAKCRQEERQKNSSLIEGIVNLDNYKIQIRRLELRRDDKVNEIDEIGIQEARIGGRKKLGNDTSAGVLGMNEEWRHMFGTTDVRSQSPKNLEPHHQPQGPSFQRLVNTPLTNVAVEEPPVENSSKLRPLSHSIPRSHIGSAESEHFGLICRYADCKLDLDDLIQLRRDHHMRNMLSKETIEKKARIRKQVPSDWKPKGVLVAHLHEHKAAVNRVLVVPDTTFFATCSNDGTVKIWDCDRMERRSVSNRSRQTYSRPDCRFVSLEVCQSCQSLACASNSGAIHVFRLESSMAKITPSLTRMLDLQEEGCVVDMSYFDTGSQSVLTYATTYGLLVGWDLRAPGNAWKLENDPKHGLVTSYCIDDRHCWLAVGTSSGAHICWDLRFRLPISNIVHRTGARVRRMAYHPLQHSWVVSAVQGNNEVSVWDMETEACQITLWASPAPPLSQTESSSDSTLCFCMPVREGIQGIITAGSDSRIRFWDFRNPNENYVIVGSADDFINPTDVSYRSQIIDGAEVVKEIWNKPHLRNEDRPRRGPDNPPSGHLDCISDIAIHQTSQWLLLSASRDGVVKVWK